MFQSPNHEDMNLKLLFFFIKSGYYGYYGPSTGLFATEPIQIESRRARGKSLINVINSKYRTHCRKCPLFGGILVTLGYHPGFSVLLLLENPFTVASLRFAPPPSLYSAYRHTG